MRLSVSPKPPQSRRRSPGNSEAIRGLRRRRGIAPPPRECGAVEEMAGPPREWRRRRGNGGAAEGMVVPSRKWRCRRDDGRPVEGMAPPRHRVCLGPRAIPPAPQLGFPQFGRAVGHGRGARSSRWHGLPAIRQISSRRRCGGPLRAAEAACRLRIRSLGGTWPRRLSAVLCIFSAMILGAFARRTVSTACATSFLQQRSAGARASARPAVNAPPLSRAPKPRIGKGGFSMSRQRTDAGVIPAGLARPSVGTGYQTA